MAEKNMMAQLCAQAVHWHRRHENRDLNATSAKELADFQLVIRGTWNSFAAAISWMLRAQEARVDPERVGYVILPAGGAQVQIPFFMTDMMLLDGGFKDIVSLAAQIRLGEGSVICLSGSICQFGNINHVSDLDFCEYIPLIDARCGTRFTFLAERHTEIGRPLLVQYLLGEDQLWAAPLSGSLLDSLNSAAADAGAGGLQGLRECLFVADVGDLGVLQVTNVILSVDYARPEADPTASKSFAFQEIPVTESSWAPRDLSDPLRLGSYLVWLMEETASLYEASLQSPARAAKAARRLISVCRLLMFGAQVDALVELLSQEGAMLVALEARCELYQMLSAHRDSQVRAARVPLRATITALRESLAATSGSRRVRSSYGSLSQDERDRLQRFAEVARPLIDRTARQVRSELRMP